jgi:hypothetical protein
MKHAVATAVVVCCIVALTVLSYLGLLAWAVIAGAPVGGPLALPFMLAAAVVLSAIAAVAVLWPVTAVSEVACRRAHCSLTVLQIPVATLLLFFEVASAGLLVALLKGQPATSGITTGAIVGLILLLPLGIYWWSLQISDWLLGRGESLCRRLARRSTLHR